MEPIVIDVHSYKGGVGVTTTACTLALAFAESGHKTKLIDTKWDAFAWMGMNFTPQPGYSAEYRGLTINLACGQDDIDAKELEGYDRIVIDSGQTPSVVPDGFDVRRLCVVRNDYMTLARTLRFSGFDPEVRFFCYLSDFGSLSITDVKSVLNGIKDDTGETITRVIGTESISSAVQRSIDAGLASDRASTWSQFANIRDLCTFYGKE